MSTWRPWLWKDALVCSLTLLNVYKHANFALECSMALMKCFLVLWNVYSPYWFYTSRKWISFSPKWSAKGVISCIRMLKFWASEPLTSPFPGSNHRRSNRSVLNVSNRDQRRTVKSKSYTLVNDLWVKIKAQNFASQMLSKHTFKIWGEKGSDFFLSQGHFKRGNVKLRTQALSFSSLSSLSCSFKVKKYFKEGLMWTEI